MSRTKKDRNYQRKIVKNSFLQKTCKTYGSDFKGSRKRTFTGGQIRKKLQRLKDKEIKEVINNIANSIDMSDLELYRIELNDKQSVFELFFDHYFRKIEGFPCSHDKSVYVSKKINKYLNTGENENLKQTYREYQQNGGNIGSITELDKICYWCPKTIKDAKEATSIIFHYLCIDINYFKNKYKKIIGENKDEK